MSALRVGLPVVITALLFAMPSARADLIEVLDDDRSITAYAAAGWSQQRGWLFEYGPEVRHATLMGGPWCSQVSASTNFTEAATEQDSWFEPNGFHYTSSINTRIGSFQDLNRAYGESEGSFEFRVTEDAFVTLQVHALRTIFTPFANPGNVNEQSTSVILKDSDGITVWSRIDRNWDRTLTLTLAAGNYSLTLLAHNEIENVVPRDLADILYETEFDLTATPVPDAGVFTLLGVGGLLILSRRSRR